VDLNAILYKSHKILADYLEKAGSTSEATVHRDTASKLRDGILDLFWDSKKLAFYDYNLTSNSRNDLYSTATFYPFWVGIVPPDVLRDQSKAFGAFASINLVMNRYNGTLPTTFIETGLQWDMPNAWPPHQYIALEALRNLPSNLTTNSIPNGDSFSLIPSGQLGITKDQLPPQHIIGGANVTSDINKFNGTVVNGGTVVSGEGWSQALQRELANRYISSAFCSWYATGGSIPNLLPRRSDQQLNLTGSLNNTGNMFEKFSNLDIDSAGRGGEYTVQAGFGWTNGVALWIAGTYGSVLDTPSCPDITVESVSGGTDTSASNGAVAFRIGASPVSVTVAAILTILVSEMVL